MKAIEIKSELKSPFLEACRLAGLEVIQLKKIIMPGRMYFQVITVNYSQDDLFKLGVCFAQLTPSVLKC
jgi:hypothetical protein